MARSEQERLASELWEARRRLDRNAPQLVEQKRRLGLAEDSIHRMQSEVLEERKARERCHRESIKSGEKFQQSRTQVAHLRERIRVLEERDLRYPSRSRRVASGTGGDENHPAGGQNSKATPFQ